MKQLLYLTILALALCSQGCSLLREVDRHRIRADSSSIRSASRSDQWTREVETVYLTDTNYIFKTDTVLKPYVLRIPQPYLVKQTVREAGSSQENSQAETKAQVNEQNVEKTFPDWVPWLIGAVFLMGFMFFFGTIIVLVIYVTRSRRPL